MGGAKTIQKLFNSFQGKDLRSSDLVRNKNSAIDYQNLIITKDYSAITRPGGKIRAPNGQFLGMHNYAYSNETTGATEEEILSISNKLYRRRANTAVFAYTGASTNVILNVTLSSTGVFEIQTVVDNVAGYYLDLGTGLESSPVTLADLKTSIEASTYTLTLSGVTTVPAAYLPITVRADMISSSVTLTYYDWEEIYCPLSTTPFSAYYAARGGDDFEFASFCNFQDCAIVATGYEYLQKYDGQTLYRVGLPRPSAVPTLSDAGGGSVDAGTHSYIYFYKQVDNRGNIAEGKESVAASITLAAGSPVDVTVTNVGSSSGYNTNCAIVNGAQVTVTTISVDVNHTLRTGDTAYFLDAVSGDYVEREVTATSGSSITIAGAAVTVADNAVISNNLRVVIARTKAGGVDYFIVEEIPNDSINATQTYQDNTADADIGAQYLFPFKSHDVLESKPRYVISHQGVLVVDGGFTEPNTTKFSDTESPETFPAASNVFDVASTTAGGISGYISNDEYLIIGKSVSLHVVTGALDENNFTIETINEGARGIACHNASADVGDGVVFLSSNGWFKIVGGFNLTEIGYPMNRIFFDAVYNESERLQLKRSVGLFDSIMQLYLCFIPCESGSGTSRYANPNSLTYAFDASNPGWGEYRGMNMGGGACISGDSLWWQSRRDDSALTVTGNLFRRHNSGTENDYADHAEIIQAELGAQWEDGGEPAKLKFIPRMRVYNLDNSSFSTAFTLTVRTELNYLYGATDSQFSYTFGASTSDGGWGYWPWGSTAWGNAVTRRPLPKKLKNSKFYALRFVFSHGARNERMAITGWEYEMVDAYRTEMTN